MHQGEKVAFAGSSGSGKSTIFRLLLGEYGPDQGEVLVEDMKSASGPSPSAFPLRQVSQETYLFPYSIRENLTLGADVSAEELDLAASIASADGFIAELPDGYDTPVGELAGRFSGGERQRLSLARAILRKPEILLLDEATSAMDYQVEHQVMGGLMELFERGTVMSIAHRLSTIVNMDRICVLREGELVESGTHESLMAAKGRYAALYSKQETEESTGTAKESHEPKHRWSTASRGEADGAYIK